MSNKNVGSSKCFRKAIYFDNYSVNNSEMYLDIDELRDRERLVNNYSVNSFISSNNELVVTRTYDGRRYSTMLFKPTDRNQVDIVVTKGNVHEGNEDISAKRTSNDERQVYSIRARLLVGLVFFMLMVMLVVLVVCLVLGTPSISSTNGRGDVSELPVFNDIGLSVLQQNGTLRENGAYFQYNSTNNALFPTVINATAGD